MKLLSLLTRGVMKFSLKDFRKNKDFAHKRQVKHTSTVLEPPSIPIHTLVKLVDTEHFTQGKFRTLYSILETNNVTSKLESQNLSAETHDSNTESKFMQTTYPNIVSKSQFLIVCSFCHEPNHSVSNCFRKQREDEERKRIPDQNHP